MVGVIVHDHHVARTAEDLESALHSIEGGNARRHLVHRGAQRKSHGERCECIAHVVFTWHAQQHVAQWLAVVFHGESRTQFLAPK